ncbi:RNA polymerase II transcriptional coactivator, putative [Paecilomyces variotii No. 5]|uniref:RNA polymerase II transcriptional coactivator, putative n=1 Tax=Byssochlamys spectabilis (strain No. 5 / NBRC 109023) TaxID=1356009 RepID=V5GBJ4_BYSSN|nr:RNA polymerase II transcriptional coactivator, putative [Paecilomyces variotii No. 5]
MAPKSNKRQARQDSYDEGDDFVVSDSEGRGRSKKVKRETSKKQSETFAGRNGSAKVDSNGDTYWEISRLRRVTISTFRGKTMVNIREYYEKDGQELPGKKTLLDCLPADRNYVLQGISMPIDQFSAFISVLPQIESVLHEKGVVVPRPEYDESGEEVEGDKDTSSKEAAVMGRSNIEETSEEEDEE